MYFVLTYIRYAAAVMSLVQSKLLHRSFVLLGYFQLMARPAMKSRTSFSRRRFMVFLVVIWLRSLAGMLVTGTTTPPLLDVPTYSLATTSVDGRTAMNILTYATPVSATPVRMWVLSLFKGEVCFVI